MKQRFNSLDTVAIVLELQKILKSRVIQIYDVDNKTYLIKLNTTNSNKIVLLFESGIRIHTTKCDWPKNQSPSGFTMKLRKHIRNKRIAKVEQLGCDRIINIQFGTGEAAYHLFLELFNRGNIVLTDYELTIVSLLRSYNEGDIYHFAAHEKYPIDRARLKNEVNLNKLKEILSTCKKTEQIRKVLLPHIDFGQSFLEHCLRKSEINPDMRVNHLKLEEYSENLIELVKQLSFADNLLEELKSEGPKGYILCSKKRNEKGDDFVQMLEFNPYNFVHNSELELNLFDTFTDAIDEYFSKLESQKFELGLMEKEREAIKKVTKIREDQQSRLIELSQKQQQNKIKADRIMNNASLVENALQTVRSAIASQMPWGSIQNLITEGARQNDPIASVISRTKFEVNQISLTLCDPFAESDEENLPIEVDIDLALSAHANAKRYYDDKKHAAIKEKKTLESQQRAIKCAEKKAKEVLNTALTQVAITVSRKIYWFEKFYWFISSDNYLVIGGRDQKQNEIIVKKYMKAGDIYVHADLIGASSVVIKNPLGAPVPPRTLDEAGVMAVCYSNAWESKVLCRAWWVYENQVSKSAPSGEYLVTGSFMIRGQKNFLLPTTLQLGFSLMFKIDESGAFRHIDERKPKGVDEVTTLMSSILNKPIEVTVEADTKAEISTSEHVKPPECSSYYSPPNITTDEGNLSGIVDVKDSVDTINCSYKQNKIMMTSSKEHDNENIATDTADPLGEFDDLEKDEAFILLTKSGSSLVHFETPDQKAQLIGESLVEIPKEAASNQGKLKRGQKSRQKKIKEKYKDQDEEEKLLRMSILQSAGSSKVADKKLRKKHEKRQPTMKEIEHADNKDNLNKFRKMNEQHSEVVEEVEVPTEVDMLSLLTGQPHPEDEILFAIPVVSPYSAVISNKFKMKMSPGTTKRGKAARSILEAFIRSKDCTPREKEVIRSINDQLLSQNLPGKVKLLNIQPKKK